jgi:hypothetical protein
MVRVSNPELPGGSTALVAINNNEMQKPPTALGRMHASCQKQIAFNKWVVEKENEIAHINSEMADFLIDMDLGLTTFVFLNVGERMRCTQQVCGQLWINVSRKMTATRTVLPGLSTSRGSMTLSGISEVLTWRQVLEFLEEYPRPGKRVIIYPDFLQKT